MQIFTCWADGRTALGLRQSACKAKRPVSGWGQGRQPPEAGARSASLEPSRSQVYVNTVAPRRRIRLVTVVGGLRVLSRPVGPTRLPGDEFVLSPSSAD